MKINLQFQTNYHEIKKTDRELICNFNKRIIVDHVSLVKIREGYNIR